MLESRQVWHNIRNRLLKTRLLILGEMHGASVNPRIARELIRRLDIRTVLIEVNAKYAKLFSRLTVRTLQKTAEVIRKTDPWLFEAGVLSMAHLRLYATLNEQNVRVIPVKIESRDWNRAENLTTEEIRRNIAPIPGPALAIVGRLHARKRLFVQDANGKPQKYIPLGWRLRGQSVTMQIRYGKGEIYNFRCISVGEKSVLLALDRKMQLLQVSRSIYFDFEYLVRDTKPLAHGIR